MTAPLNVGLIGAGWFGREAHLSNLVQMEGVRVPAVSSRSRTSREQAQAIAGDQTRTVEDWHDVLAMDEIDAVIIALTNVDHHAACLAAFAAGKHVLCEKPLGLTVAECDEILAAAADAGRVLQVGHEMRFQRLYQHVHAMVGRGEVGAVRWMWCREFRGPMRPGWRSSEALTGGTLLEKNSHHFDLFNWILDRPARKVMATGGRDVLHDREVLDNAMVQIEYEGGLRASLHLSLFAPFGGDCEIGVLGSGGRIDTWNQARRLTHHRFDVPERLEMDVADFPDEAGFRDASGRIDRGIRPELLHFLECCRTGATPLTDGRSARESVILCLAAQESIRRGEAVTCAEIAGA